MRLLVVVAIKVADETNKFGFLKKKFWEFEISCSSFTKQKQNTSRGGVN